MDLKDDNYHFSIPKYFGSLDEKKKQFMKCLSNYEEISNICLRSMIRHGGGNICLTLLNLSSP